MLALRKPYLIFLGGVVSETDAKTGFGLRDWIPQDCLGQLRLPGCQVDLGLPDLTPTGAAAQGAGSLVIGVAPPGGQIDRSWTGVFEQAVTAGLDIVSGLHESLSDQPELAKAARLHGTSLIDVRRSDRTFAVGTGRKRPGRRLLTVGTDCAVGKKYAALAITRELRQRGVAATFRATGQTGILIAGGGVAIDAVVADFISGAAEALSPDAPSDHWDVIEGQGSLFHPSYAGVSLGLLHGSQPDALVVCHEPTRGHLEDLPHVPVPPLDEVIARNVEAAKLTNPAARCVGVSINTAKLADLKARQLLAAISDSFNLPAQDPLRTGLGEIADALQTWS